METGRWFFYPAEARVIDDFRHQNHPLKLPSSMPVAPNVEDQQWL
jgi:hypothetical protein